MTSPIRLLAVTLVLATVAATGPAAAQDVSSAAWQAIEPACHGEYQKLCVKKLVGGGRAFGASSSM